MESNKKSQRDLEHSPNSFLHTATGKLPIQQQSTINFNFLKTFFSLHPAPFKLLLGAAICEQ
jgi:hypothetical protein